MQEVLSRLEDAKPPRQVVAGEKQDATLRSKAHCALVSMISLCAATSSSVLGLNFSTQGASSPAFELDAINADALSRSVPWCPSHDQAICCDPLLGTQTSGSSLLPSTGKIDEVMVSICWLHRHLHCEKYCYVVMFVDNFIDE